MKTKLGIIAAILVVTLAGEVYAKSSNSLGYQVVSGSSDEMNLEITADIPSSGMFLGVTFYPPNVKNTAKEGVVKIFSLKKGRSVQDITIEPRMKNGSFEAAVWTKKISANECLSTDSYCKSLGYKLIEMRAYIWGYLVP